jgi:hypothetical protein
MILACDQSLEVLAYTQVISGFPVGILHCFSCVTCIASCNRINFDLGSTRTLLFVPQNRRAVPLPCQVLQAGAEEKHIAFVILAAGLSSGMWLWMWVWVYSGGLMHMSVAGND